MDSARALEQFVKSQDQKYADTVKSKEKDGDEKRMELIQALNRTFITPFDREDIYILSKSLDDILDYFKTTVSEMEIYCVKPSDRLLEMIRKLKDGAWNIWNSVYNMKQNPSLSTQYAIKAKKCENKVETIYRQSVAELLESDDIKYIIKLRELYRHLSNCADRIDQAADMICNILMKAVS
jgi:predicted phosphate transport protein (TIGR00153 family)